MPHPRPAAARLLLAVVCTSLATTAAAGLSACTSGGTMTDPQATARAVLAQRPDFETADAAYRALARQVAEALTQRHGVTPFTGDPQTSDAGCSDLPNVGGRTRTYALRGSSGSIRDDVWPAAMATVQELAGRSGFTVTSVVVDAPGDHEISIANPADGSRLVFGTKVNTILTVYGACHLPRATGATG